MKKKIRVLIVDDSATVRQALKDILSTEREIEVMATAPDPIIAANKISSETPDVIILDIEMPRMDGITFLRKIMSENPIPVIICSHLISDGCDTMMKALEYGAIEIIEKPKLGTEQYIKESRIRICNAIKAASLARLKPISTKKHKITRKLTADDVIEKPFTKSSVVATEKIVVVGASTGGVEAIRSFLEVLPPYAPGIVIVQHMPEKFTEAFAKLLNNVCDVSVKEAVNNDTVVQGQVLIAPGSHHVLLKRKDRRYYIETKGGPLVSGHRPSVDVLFRSAARYAGKNAVGIIMTGMGADGAKGMLEMKEAGATNIAQDEATSTVFGMPHKAVQLGGVDTVLPLEKIPEEAIRLCGLQEKLAMSI